MTTLRTFQNADPAVDDVVLCHYCGESLQDEEHDVFWEQSQNHECVPMLKGQIADLMRPVSFAETDAAVATVPIDDGHRVSWLTEPLHLAHLVRFIIYRRAWIKGQTK